MMVGYYAVFTWLPTFLKTEGGLSVMDAGWYTMVVIVGSFIGYLAAAYLSDHIRREKTFFIFASGSAIIAVLYTLIPISKSLVVFGISTGIFCVR